MHICTYIIHIYVYYPFAQVWPLLVNPVWKERQKDREREESRESERWCVREEGGEKDNERARETARENEGAGKEEVKPFSRDY